MPMPMSRGAPMGQAVSPNVFGPTQRPMPQQPPMQQQPAFEMGEFDIEAILRENPWLALAAQNQFYPQQPQAMPMARGGDMGQMSRPDVFYR